MCGVTSLNRLNSVLVVPQPDACCDRLLNTVQFKFILGICTSLTFGFIISQYSIALALSGEHRNFKFKLLCALQRQPCFVASFSLKIISLIAGHSNSSTFTILSFGEHACSKFIVSLSFA